MQASNSYRERVNYDGNGNIDKYVRKSFIGTNMDSLTYTYYPGTNKLKRITDPHGTNTTYSDLANQPKVTNYTYDAVGNLLADSLETLHSIKWNVYGKIKELTKDAGHWTLTRKTRFEYDAQGNRISKASQINNNWEYSWYVRDAQGNILSNYSARSNDANNHQNANLWQDERYIYGSSRLGHYDFSITAEIDNSNNGPEDVRADAINTHNRGRKQYELTNHLGNVVTTITDRKFGVASPSNSSLVGYYETDITGAVEYYPFGMAAKGVQKSGYGYRFGFNGKENDNDIKGGFGTQINFGNRIYDSRVGVFLSTDPFKNHFPSSTPYSFAGNNPTNMTDYNGLFKISPWFAKRYPSLANFLSKAVPSLKTDFEMRDRWINKLGIGRKMGVKMWEEMLEFGSGPYVTPNRPDNEFKGKINVLATDFFGNPRGGSHVNLYPNNLAIGYGYFDDLEAALKGGNEDEIGYRTFLTFVMVMHEAGHWARTKAGLPQRAGEAREDGAMAEEAIFGRRFNYARGFFSNAPGSNALNTKAASSYYSNFLSQNKPANSKGSLMVPQICLCMTSSALKGSGVKGQAGDRTLLDNGDKENDTPPQRKFSYEYKKNDDFYYPKN